MQEAWEYVKEENFQMKGAGKNQEKDIRTRTIRRKRERELCVSLHKNIVLGRACKEPSIYLILIAVHSFPV